MNNVKIELKWAFFFSIVGLLWMLLEKASGLHDKYIDYHPVFTMFFAIPAIIMMVLALKDKKKNFYGGSMSYKQGLISGIVLSVFIGLLTPLTQWVTSYVITPDYFANAIPKSVEIGYFKSIEEAEANFNYKSYAIKGSISAVIMGIITTAIAMIFIRTKPGDVPVKHIS